MTMQTLPTAEKSAFKDLLLAGVIALILMLLYMALMPATQLWDRDEPLYARAAVEMLLSGNWELPTYNGHLFAHKPPMTYWFMATSFSLFGQNEFAARLFSAPFMAGTAFVTYLTGRRMFDHVIGLWAMIIFGTCLLSFYLGSIAQHDALLAFFITLAIYSYVNYLYGRQNLWPMLLLFTLAMTATLYIKGPVGPAVVCTTLFFSWLLSPQDTRPAFKTMLLFVAGFILASLLLLIWLVPADIATHGDLWKIGVDKHIIKRFEAPLENYGGTASLGYYWMLPAYIPSLAITFMPWSIHLPAGLKALFCGTLGTRRERAVLWGWIAPTFLMFTLAASKLPHYIFPMFPALGIMCAAIIVEQSRAQGAKPYAKFGAWLYLGLTLGLIVALFAAPFIRPDIIPFWLGIPAAVVLLLCACLVFSRQRQGDALGASKLLIFTTPLVILFCYWVIVPRIEPVIKISKDIGHIINQAKVSKDHIYMQGYLEPSMVFYINAPLGHPLTDLPYSDEAVKNLLAKNEELVLIAKEKRFEEVQKLAADRPFKILGTVSAINTNDHLEKQTVIVAVRRSS